MTGAGHSIRGETLTRAMCVKEWPFLLLMNAMRAQSQERSQSTNKSIAGGGAVALLSDGPHKNCHKMAAGARSIGRVEGLVLGWSWYP